MISQLSTFFLDIYYHNLGLHFRKHPQAWSFYLEECWRHHGHDNDCWVRTSHSCAVNGVTCTRANNSCLAPIHIVIIDTKIGSSLSLRITSFLRVTGPRREVIIKDSKTISSLATNYFLLVRTIHHATPFCSFKDFSRIVFQKLVLKPFVCLTKESSNCYNLNCHYIWDRIIYLRLCEVQRDPIFWRHSPLSTLQRGALTMLCN